MVDASGNYITNQQKGLLLYNGLTLCQDNFNLTAAHAVCKHMGFKGAVSWTSGQVWKIQEDYNVFSHSLACSAQDWSSCSLKMYSKSCNDHTQDVFLTCSGARSAFTLVNFSGSQMSGLQQFLLLHNGGTVCGDLFSDNSADAICRDMGFFWAESWRIGDPSLSKTEYHIALDDVKCSAGNWSSCSYTTSHDCPHGQVIYLSCRLIPANDGTCAIDNKKGRFSESTLAALICIAGVMIVLYVVNKDAKIRSLLKDKNDTDALVKTLQDQLKVLQEMDTHSSYL